MGLADPAPPALSGAMSLADDAGPTGMR
jgi:hypothetical protein